MENEEKKIENTKIGKNEKKSTLKYLIAGLVSIIIILIVIVSILLFKGKNNDNKNSTTIENNASNISVKGSSYEELIKNGISSENNIEQSMKNKQENTNATSNSEELNTDFKNAMDSYEKYIDEYIAFMKKYSENPTDTSLLTQYASMYTKYQQAVKDFENWNTKNLNKAEQKYYVEVQTRVTKKLTDASIDMQ